MKIEQTRKLTPMERFLYWIEERHRIYIKRKKGLPPPWTDDEILQTEFFTNPYRENDKTTVWFRENIRDPLRSQRDVLMATVIFRWFNKIETAQQVLMPYDLLRHWDEKLAVEKLRELNKKQAVFTGAFMIKVSHGPPGCKIPQVCECITDVWQRQKYVLAACRTNTLESVWQELKQFRGLGGFLSYEIVCDLRYTDLLRRATDVNSWCNIGPGASRGLNRLAGRKIIMAKGGTKDSGRKPPVGWQKEMRKLLALCKLKLKHLPKFEMREAEHSLCEYDKYERVLFGEGRSKRKYNGRT